MRPRASIVFPVLLALVLLAPAARGRESALRDSTSDRLRLLQRWAHEAVDQPSVEARQRALRMLDEVLHDDPGNAAAWVDRGRLDEIGLQDRAARACYARATALAPTDPEPHLRLAMAWRHEWLRWLDAAALDSAIVSFERVVALRPNAYEARMRLVPLEVERGDAARAMVEAERAAAARPRRGEPAMAVAYLAYRRGEIERADSLFQWAYDRVTPDLRRRLEDLGPLLGPAAAAQVDSLPPAARAREEQRLWARMDPDPTTPQNEMRLEFWSRVVHAWLLFDDPMRPGTDARVEAYVRYGPPGATQINPPGIPLFNRFTNAGLAERRMHGGNDIDPAEFPVDAMVMPYPDLAMRIVLQDRTLLGHYDWPLDRAGNYAAQAMPDLKRLADRGDLLATGGGFAVFPTLPPREQRLEVSGTLARFEGERGPRLLAQGSVPATPRDTLFARWAVRDSSGRERVRQEQRLGTSVCDPAGRRIAELNVALPPGTFDVTLSVRDTHHRRGIYRVAAALVPPGDSLALSDAVLTCGEPEFMVQGRAIRLEADREARVPQGAPLVAYFEIYRLAAAPDGLSRFESEYSVHRLLQTPASGLKPESAVALASTSARREEVQPGPLRRQFLTVPVQALAPGRYQLQIRVRDLTTGAVARRDLDFVKE